LNQSEDNTFPTTQGFRRWKRFWHEKILLLWFHRDGWNMSRITAWFESKGKAARIGRGTLHSEWQRGSVEVRTLDKLVENVLKIKITALVTAVTADKEASFSRVSSLSNLLLDEAM
jgi:hypothetical protein